ncbi:MAG: sugar nucleotide-binding protein [Eubacterium sp.]|nr:sugar nucleotide-binding protein [Eubacterium sp.]
MVALVGYTGFVGSNIYIKGGVDKGYNSKNIEQAYGSRPDILIYAGMRAEKYLANADPEADMKLVCQAEENIKKIAPKKLILISTIDIFGETNGKNEDASVDIDGLLAYGLNRYRLEQWTRENYSDALIIRLPGLYGINIKKNFIYDFINVVPFMLKEKKFHELSSIEPKLCEYYEMQNNGFYRCKVIDANEKEYLKKVFRQLDFTAINFTDSCSVFQFYPLDRLWSDIQIALKNDLRVWHPATEPVSAAEVYKYLTGKEFSNIITNKPAEYDYRTKYGYLFGKKGEYIMTKEEVLKDIKQFTERIDSVILK